MTAEQLLARAGDLPGARDIGGVRFAPIVSSPLLIAHVRGAGGTGGRRVRAGAQVDLPAFAVLVEWSGRQPSLTPYGSAQACAQAFNDELRRAARDGLGSMPEPVGTSAERLLTLGAELLG
jgi:hypothetical protein